MIKAGSNESDANQLIENLKSAPLQADVLERDLAMLSYAIRLTEEPASISEADIQRLRQHGFDDRAIHDLACCVSYFAFVNRIADGLGVLIEDS